ncbi:MAG: nitroreductase [Gammaproteobacteria bacterium]|nr:nitroreductase [Gammaproteobacteria bacterium]
MQANPGNATVAEAAAGNLDNDIRNVITGRRTINRFVDRPVPRQLVRDAIDAARWAPNHRRTEPWRFYLFGSATRAAVIDRIVDLKAGDKTERARAAVRARLDGVPGWLALTTQRADDALLAEENYAACCCAAQNLALALWQAGIGMKWTTGKVTRDPRFYELVHADPDLERVVGLFWYGYPDETVSQDRKPVDEITTELP